MDKILALPAEIHGHDPAIAVAYHDPLADVVGEIDGPRVRLAHDLGLPTDADWDQVYARWRAKWTFWRFRNAGKILLISSVLPAIVMQLTIWFLLKLIVAIILFVLSFGILWFRFALAVEDQYWGNIDAEPLISRAKKDGIFVE